MIPFSFDDSSSSAPATTWRLVLAYDGSDFQGWQIQPGVPTIQGALASVLRELFGENALPQGSGRTDSGVHAEGQVVSMALRVSLPPERLASILNRRLPSSIRVVSAEAASENFHARSDVRSKLYEFRIFERRSLQWQGERVCPPVIGRFVWDCHWLLDLDRMQAGAEYLIGSHDFTSFAAVDADRSSRAAKRPTPSMSVRTVHESHCIRRDGLLVYRVSGTGFLHHMVRNIVGTLVDVGRGHREPEEIPSILHARSRAEAGPTAPPQGLFLMHVIYKGGDTKDGDKPASEPAGA